MLKAASSDTLDYIERAYKFVRDEIPHTWDAKLTVVSKSASDVLKNKTGICWTKSCLLAALLRANKIPSGISYQYLTRADDASDGYIIHALNTVYIDSLKKWIRLDARGNKAGVNAQFFSVRLAVLQSGWLRSDGRRKNNRRNPLYAYEALRIVTKSFVRG